MTDLLTHLGTTGQENVAVIVAMIAGLIAVDLVWRIIRKLQRRQARRRADAELTADLLAAYPETMTEEECKRMNAEHWNGD
jgi:hypothetical protein